MTRCKAAVLALASLALAASCSPQATTTATLPLATSESRITNGFQFTVTVSNVHPRPGEGVVINARLLNLYNVTIPVDQVSGSITLQITDDRGNIVWRETDNRLPPPTTTPAPPVGTGFSWDFTRTWTAGGNYTVPATGTYTPILPLTTGVYTLSASTTLFGLEVTPIQITVSDV
jgi:hypothetical protein